MVLPPAVATMWLMARHVLAIQHDAGMPASRRRIRTANGLLMIFVTALLSYALGIMHSGPTSSASVAEVRTFVMVWGTIIGLLPMVIGLAMLDAVNNMRLHMATRRGLREQLGAKMARDLVVLARQRRAGGAMASRSGDDARGDAGIMSNGNGGE